jgi:hypothetical protein
MMQKCPSLSARSTAKVIASWCGVYQRFVYAKEENDLHRRDALLVGLRQLQQAWSQDAAVRETAGKSLDDSPTRPEFGCVVSESRFIGRRKIRLSTKSQLTRADGSPLALRPNLVLHIPHSSRAIPHEERENLVLDDTDLERELLRMTDALPMSCFRPHPSRPRESCFPSAA